MRVKRDDESLIECVKDMFRTMRENGVQLSTVLIDMSSSYESAMDAALKGRKAEYTNPIDVVATVRNY